MAKKLPQKNAGTKSKSDNRKPIFSRIQDEQGQTHGTRVAIFERLEQLLQRKVMTCFTSFRHPVELDDGDADMIEEVLRHTDLSQGLALIISSPGGDGLAAERIINLCRSLSGTGEFVAIVPARAMSAATLVCFGASEIMMSPSSQLGPVDPQIAVEIDGQQRLMSAHTLVDSYTELFHGAVNTNGHMDPYVQQLNKYDYRSVQVYKQLINLSKKMAVKSLKSGMMRRIREQDIPKKIQRFLDPKHTLSHGRPIFRDDARQCGLRITDADARGEMWNSVYELYMRTNLFVSGRVGKCIETASTSMFAPVTISEM